MFRNIPLLISYASGVTRGGAKANSKWNAIDTAALRMLRRDLEVNAECGCDWISCVWSVFDWLNHKVCLGERLVRKVVIDSKLLYPRVPSRRRGKRKKRYLVHISSNSLWRNQLFFFCHSGRLLMFTDAFLVTSIRQGLNLWLLEYVHSMYTAGRNNHPLVSRRVHSSLLLKMIFDTKMSMPCLHKVSTIREETKMSVVLLPQSFLRHEFLLVGQTLFSAIFKNRCCCSCCYKKSIKGPNWSLPRSVKHNWGQKGKDIMGTW